MLSLLLWLAVVAGACGSPGPNSEPAVVRVFAAASLTNAFSELEQGFEAANPGIDVELNLGGSSSLRAQILSGAPADVFASASEAMMDQVVEAVGTVEAPRSFATNRLEIAVPEGNPAGVAGLSDFERPELFLGLCAEAVPCGTLADQALAAAGVEPSIDSREPDVRALLTKVAAGELDAGIVYATDVLALADEIDGIEIPPGLTGPAVYPIAVPATADNPDGGATFVAYVLSPEGRATLAEQGFGRP